MFLRMILKGRGLPDMTAALRGISGKDAHRLMGRAIRREGDKVRSAVTTALARQTGAGRQGVLKALREGTRRAKGGFGVTRSALEYRIDARGEYLALKLFKARPTKRGVSAAPWNERRIFRGTFFAKMKSGHIGVFKRDGDGRTPISELWGPSIPNEMVKGETKATFDRATAGLEGRILLEVARQAKLKLEGKVR